jgi:hypothetical protein
MSILSDKYRLPLPVARLSARPHARHISILTRNTDIATQGKGGTGKKKLDQAKRMTRNNVPGTQTKNVFAGRVN